jgi:hypothetical protein
MAKFEKGNPGKPKGAKNKVTKTFKELLQNAIDELQDDPKANMIVWAKENPTEFYKIASKLIPTELQGNLNNTGVIRVVRE